MKSGWRDARCANEKIPFDKRMKMGQSPIRSKYKRIERDNRANNSKCRKNEAFTEK